MKFSKMIALLLFIPLVINAGVNLKNGNYYVSYTDIIVPGGGHDLEISRTYNSRSTEVGWFGFGWGSDYETYLVVSADGSVVVHENGAGALTRFTPNKAVDAKAAAEKIVEAMRERSPIAGKAATDLIEKLSKDAELRQAYARKFNVQAKLADGTVLHSNVRGIQQLIKIATGFKRVHNDGKIEFFNKDGKLEKITTKNGYAVTLNYEKGVLNSIKDSQAKQLFFSWYSSGQVENIWSVDSKTKVSYKYQGKDLIESKNVANATYKYSYDRNHNMTEITYMDGSSRKVSYTPKTQYVSKIVERNGEEIVYKYDSNPKNPELHYWTTVTKKHGKGKERTNRYEYEIKIRPDGSQYTYRIVTDINGIKTDTTYAEANSLPIKIVRGKHVTTFEYNDKGLLVKKASTKGDYIKLAYHEKFNKITKVTNKQGWTSFDYDGNGNLSKAVNSDGKSVLLIYDRNGRITKMIDQQKNQKRTLSFTYNALGKPVEIAMDNVGKINVAYDNYGEIKKVESKAGHKMALQVTQAFQSLLAIVKPAGVNLNM